MTDDVDTGLSPIELATDLTMAWLGNPNTRVDAADVPVFLKAIHEAVSELSSGIRLTAPDSAPEAAPEHVPAVTVRKSLASKDHIISMIDGKPYRTLKRHLSTNGLTPAEYRERYGLKADYPITAPSYSEARKAMALKIGLGRKRG
jgi:predicted transcriptional regulator